MLRSFLLEDVEFGQFVFDRNPDSPCDLTRVPDFVADVCWRRPVARLMHPVPLERVAGLAPRKITRFGRRRLDVGRHRFVLARPFLDQVLVFFSLKQQRRPSFEFGVVAKFLELFAFLANGFDLLPFLPIHRRLPGPLGIGQRHELDEQLDQTFGFVPAINFSKHPATAPVNLHDLVGRQRRTVNAQIIHRALKTFVAI